MNLWDRLTGRSKRLAEDELAQALTNQDETRCELFEVVSDLQELVNQLSALPETQSVHDQHGPHEGEIK